MTTVILLFLLDRYSKTLAGVTFTPAPLVSPAVTVLVLLALAVVWWGVAKGMVKLRQAALITLGAASNLYDVVTSGRVIDYLPIWHYTTNFADLMIVIGAILSIIQIGQRFNEWTIQSAQRP